MQKYPMVYLREDELKIVIYENGERLAMFPDGTKILNRGFGKEYEIEHPRMPIIKVLYPEKDISNLGSMKDLVKFTIRDCERRKQPMHKYIESLTIDGRYAEIQMPDRSSLFVCR